MLMHSVIELVALLLLPVTSSARPEAVFVAVVRCSDGTNQLGMFKRFHHDILCAILLYPRLASSKPLLGIRQLLLEPRLYRLLLLLEIVSQVQGILRQNVVCFCQTADSVLVASEICFEALVILPSRC